MVYEHWKYEASEGMIDTIIHIIKSTPKKELREARDNYVKEVVLPQFTEGDTKETNGRVGSSLQISALVSR